MRSKSDCMRSKVCASLSVKEFLEACRMYWADRGCIRVCSSTVPHGVSKSNDNGDHSRTNYPVLTLTHLCKQELDFCGDIIET
jgi:hypothetical protein